MISFAQSNTLKPIVSLILQAKILKRLDSPYVVRCFEHSDEDATDVFWIVMEKLDGKAMDSMLGIAEIDALRV